MVRWFTFEGVLLDSVDWWKVELSQLGAALERPRPDGPHVRVKGDAPQVDASAPDEEGAWMWMVGTGLD